MIFLKVNSKLREFYLVTTEIILLLCLMASLILCGIVAVGTKSLVCIHKV